MKRFQISIPEPCDEDWEKMTHNEKGRFCDLCCKNVVDFTNKSTAEIQEYFSVNIGNNIYGHLKKNTVG